MNRCLWAATATLVASCQTVAPSPLLLTEHLQQWQGQRPEIEITSRPNQPPRRLAPGEPVNADDGAAIAILLNPQVRVARTAAGAASAGLNEADAWVNPELSAELRRTLDTGASPWILGAQLSFTLPLSGRPGATKAWMGSLASQQRWRALVLEQDMARAVRLGWIRWSLSERRVELITQYLATLRPLVEVAGKLADHGELAASAVGVLPLELAARELELAEASAHSVAERGKLLGLMGLSPTTPLKLVAGLNVTAAAARPEGFPMDHARIALAAAAHAADGAAVQLELANRTPDITLGLPFELDRGDASIGLGVSMPIPVINRNAQGIAQARGNRRTSAARAQAAVQSLVTEASLAAVNEKVAGARLERLLALDRLVDAQLERLKGLAAQGELDVLVLRHVLERSLTTRLAIAHARAAQSFARVELGALHATVSPEDRP